MDGYSMMADSYRMAVEQGKIDKEVADKEIRIFTFLASCDKDDFCRLVDSSAFNDIIKAYLKVAVDNANIDKTSKYKVVEQLCYLLEGTMAKEVLELQKLNKA